MKYNRVSADCHIDLCWMPPDLFVTEARPSMRARMPYVTDGPDGPYWTCKNGTSFGLKNGLGPSGAKYVPGTHARADLMAATNLYEDGKILISANKWKQKTLNIQRDPRVTLCVLQEEPRFRYLQVSGRAVVTEEDLVETSTRIYHRHTAELRENFAEWLKEQERVVLVLTPEQASPQPSPPGQS